MMLPGGKLTWENFRFFAAHVSAQRGLDEKRAFVKEHQREIDDCITHTLETGSPSEAFAVVDAAKSIVTRNLLFEKCFGKLLRESFGDGDVFVHGTLPSDIYDILGAQPDLVVVNLYQSPSYAFWALIAFNNAGMISTEKLLIADGAIGRELYRSIMLYADLRAGRSTSGVKLLPILTQFARALIPRIQSIGGLRRLLLIPHKALHLLPLHIMFDEAADNPIFLEQAVRGLTYGSSLLAYGWHSVHLHGQEREAGRKILACVDSKGLGPHAILEAEAYKETLRGWSNLDIITDSDTLPTNLNSYALIIWSSHGVSDPMDWRRSHLCFGSKEFSAAEIAERWQVNGAGVAILSACETGLDLTSGYELDEYCGLDMAFHIAGARSIISTMWPVAEPVALLTNQLLFEACLSGQPLSSFLPKIRVYLLSGEWRRLLLKVYEELNKSPETTLARKQIVEMLLDTPDELFSDVSSWAVYRCFGGW